MPASALSHRADLLLLDLVTSGEFPRFVYKYRPPGERTLEIFKTQCLWFASASSFNDPFDCDLSETETHTLGDLEQYIEYIGLNAQQRIEMLSRFLREPKAMRSMWLAARRKAIDSSGILSLSRVHDNILMWSHYALNHTGLVLGFDLTKDTKFFHTAFNVTYTSTYEETNYFRDRNGSTTRNISTKSDLWSYEQEVRILKESGGLKKFLPQCLTDIYFGCRAAQEIIDETIRVCRAGELQHAAFHRVEKMHGVFSLRFTQIT